MDGTWGQPIAPNPLTLRRREFPLSLLNQASSSPSVLAVLFFFFAEVFPLSSERVVFTFCVNTSSVFYRLLSVLPRPSLPPTFPLQCEVDSVQKGKSILSSTT